MKTGKPNSYIDVECIPTPEGNLIKTEYFGHDGSLDHYEWNLNGELHHPTEPAIEYVNKESYYVTWYQYGERHRIDGPAMIYYGSIPDVNRYVWYIKGKVYIFDGYCSRLGITGEDKLALKLKYG